MRSSEAISIYFNQAADQENDRLDEQIKKLDNM